MQPHRKGLPLHRQADLSVTQTLRNRHQHPLQRHQVLRSAVHLCRSHPDQTHQTSPLKLLRHSNRRLLSQLPRKLPPKTAQSELRRPQSLKLRPHFLNNVKHRKSRAIMLPKDLRNLNRHASQPLNKARIDVTTASFDVEP